MNEYVYALMANFSFALGSQFFTYFSRKVSSIWMNCFKALVAFACFGVIVFFTGGFQVLGLGTFSLFLISGFIGLGIGDIFLLNAFKEIGPGRSLLLFGFEPLLVGILGYIFLGQSLNATKFIGIIFFIICLAIFSIENFRKNKSWDFKGIAYALVAMALDGVGTLITRLAFDTNSAISSFEGNFHRCTGAVLAFVLISYFYRFDFRANFKKLELKERGGVFLGAILGTVISLSFFLKAIQITSSLATISAISITSVLFSATFESFFNRELPSRYLLLALIFFLMGMRFVLS